MYDCLEHQLVTWCSCVGVCFCRVDTFATWVEQHDGVCRKKKAFCVVCWYGVPPASSLFCLFALPSFRPSLAIPLCPSLAFPSLPYHFHILPFPVCLVALRYATRVNEAESRLEQEMEEDEEEEVGGGRQEIIAANVQR